MDILIKQVGTKCELWHGNEKIMVAGRVVIKKQAKELHLETGDSVFNIKQDNSKVKVW